MTAQDFLDKQGYDQLFDTFAQDEICKQAIIKRNLK